MPPRRILEVKLQSLTNFKDFADYIEGKIAKQVQDTLASVVSPIRTMISTELRSAINASPEYKSLLAGQLRLELGLEEPEYQVNAIVDYVANAIYVAYQRPIKDSFLGRLNIYFLKANFSDVIGLPTATYISRSVKKGTSLPIPWLKWLLLEGDSIILAKYALKIDYRKRYTSSRTGPAIMIRPKTSGYIGRLAYYEPGWRVPPEYSGTAANNWLTRTVASIDAKLRENITDLILRKIRGG